MRLAVLGLLCCWLAQAAPIKYDKDLPDSPELRTQLLDELFSGREQVGGEQVREAFCRYFLRVGPAAVDQELLRLYAEGVFSEEDYTSFYSIQWIEFFLKKKAFAGVDRPTAEGMLHSDYLMQQVNAHVKDFSDFLMGEMMGLIRQGRLNPGPAPEGQDASQQAAARVPHEDYELTLQATEEAAAPNSADRAPEPDL